MRNRSMRQSGVKNWLRLAIALIAITPMTMLAQGSATVTGSVTERGSSNPLQGAQVSIPGTRLGAAANANGSFTIRGVEPGSIKVRAQMIGYEPIIQTVQVPASGTVTVTFTMTRTATTLSGV